MSETEIAAEFAQLHGSSARSKTARLRDLYDQIDALKNRGFSHATILNAMKKHGLVFDLKTFETTFYRIKKERTRTTGQAHVEQSKRGLDELLKEEEISKVGSAASPRPEAGKVPRQTVQESVRSIARSQIDPNQYLDE